MANGESKKKVNRNMFRKYPDVVSVKEVCEMLGFKPTKVYELIRTGELKRIHSGRVIKVTKNAVIDYVLHSAQNEEDSPV